MKYIRYLKFLFTSRINAPHFFFAYILIWVVFLALCFFAAIFITLPIDTGTPIFYIIPVLLWTYTATISFRRLCDIGIRRIIAGIIALVGNFPFYWDETWYLLIPLALLIVLTATKGKKSRNKYGNPDTDGFMASVFKIRSSEHTMDTFFRYTMFIACLVIVVCGTLIYTNKDQLNFPWTETAPPQAVEPVKDDPYTDLLNKGGNYLTDDNPIEAKKVYDDAIVLDPDRPEAYSMESLIATGTEPLRLVNLSLSKKPTGFAYELRANEDNNLDEYEKTIADATEAIEMNDYTYHAYQYRAIAYLSNGQYTLSLDDSQQAISLNQDDPFLWREEGFALYKLGRCQEAIDAMDTAVNVSYGDPDTVKARDDFLNLDTSNCLDESKDSGQEPPASTSTPIDNSTSSVGA